LAARVRWKSARFVQLGIVQALLAGRRLDEQHWSVDGPSQCLVPAGRPGPFRVDIRWNAAVDRLSGAGERHATACLEFRPGAGLWTVVSFLDDAARGRWLEPVKAAFRLLADTGFGGERSRGWGRAGAPEFVEGQLPGMILPAPARVEPGTAAAPQAGVQPPVEPQPAVEPAPVEEPPAAEEAAVTELAAEPEAETAPVEEPPAAEEAVVTELAVEPEAEASPVEEPPAAEEAAVTELAAEPDAEASPVEEPPAVEEAVVTELAAEPEAEASPVEEPPAVEEAAVTELAAEPEAEASPVEEPPAVEEAAVAELAAEPEAEPSPVEEAATAEGTEIAAGEASVVAPTGVAALVVEPEIAPAPIEEPAAEPLAPPVVDARAPVPVQLHWLLSLFSPAPADAVDWTCGSYSVVTRGGRVESPSGSGELKKLVQMVAEGSVLCGGAPTGAAPDVAPDGFAHPVFRAGFAVAIPLPGVRS